MTYTFDQLKDDVRKEAEALRVHATKEERANLDLETFNPSYTSECIYGQMCEGCRSERAIDLIKKCCISFINNCGFKPRSGDFDWNDVYTTSDQVHKRETVSYLSAIEAYILLPEARNANLISYLRGETDNLEL